MRKIAMTIASIMLLASISQAQISQVTVKVDGLACAFCAYGLQKGLKRVEGVRDVKVHVDAGKAELQFKKGVSAGLEEIARSSTTNSRRPGAKKARRQAI